MRWVQAVTLWCVIVGPPPAMLSAQAEGGITVEAGWAGFAGTTRDSSTPGSGTSARPSRAARFGVRVAREFGRLGVALGFGYASTGLTEEGPDAAVVVHDLLTLYEIAPQVSLRVAHLSSGTTLRVHAGPVYDVWAVKDDNTRSRWGAGAAASVAFPLAGRWAGALRADAVVTPCVFDEGEPPAQFERRATWRTGVSVGLQYRL